MSKEVLFLAIGLSVALIVIVAIELLIPLMFRSVRLVKLWWKSGQWKLPDQIQFRTFQGKEQVVSSGRPVGVRGFHLLLVTERGQQMVSAGAAVDTDEFWQTWKHLGGQVECWFDEDGNPFDPTE